MDSTGITDRRYWQEDVEKAQLTYTGRQASQLQIDAPKLASEIFFPMLEQAGKHHTDPMNLFLLKDLIQFVDAQAKKGIRVNLPQNNNNDSKLAHVYRWTRPRIMAPLKTPHECRQQTTAYHGSVMVDIVRETFDGEKVIEKNCIYPDFQLFVLPALLGSALDLVRDGLPHGWMYEYMYDSGGFYLCESSNNTLSERIMPLNLYRRYNHAFMFPQKGVEKKTASKSYAAASTQYQKHKNNQDEDSQEPNAAAAAAPTVGGGEDIKMEIRCSHESRGMWYSTSTMYLMLTGYYVKKTDKKSHRLELQLQQFSKKKKKTLKTIPLLSIMTAFGWTLAQCIEYLEMLNLIWGHPPLSEILDCDRIMHYVCERHKQHGPTTAKQALIQIGQLNPPKDANANNNSTTTAAAAAVAEDKYVKLGHSMLSHHVLPFIGMDQASYPAKARYLLYLWWLAMMRMAKIDKSQDDHDHEVNQRYETNAAAWGSLIRRGLRHYISYAETALKSYYNNQLGKKDAKELRMEDVYKEKWFSKRLLWCLTTGIWSPKQIKKNTRRNMTMSLNRLNDATYSSYVRRINTPIKPQDKSIKPRMVHISHYGRADVADTSEGEKSGSVRSATDAFSVSTGTSSSLLWQVLKGDQMLTQSFENTTPSVLLPGATLVLLNGVPKGWTNTPAAFCRHVRDIRRQQRIDHQVSIGWQRDHQSVIYILTEAGRSIRPLICLEQYAKHASKINEYADLFAYGVIEYIDALEERSLAICFGIRDLLQRPNEIFTHCELDPAFVFGYNMNTPYVECDQSPRVTFQENMNKQGLAIHIHNPLRYQNAIVGLFYGQKPLVTTGLKHEASHGLNVIQAISTDNTDEDNMVMLLNLKQAGAFLGFSTRTYQTTSSSSSNSNLKEKDKQSSSSGGPRWDTRNRSHVHVDGKSEIGAMLKAGDIIIQSPQGENIEVRTNDEGQVTRHIKHGGILRTLLESMLHIMRGDKFSSRHGQKVTANILRQMADMMYIAETGEVVDCIQTLVSMAGRMTAGHLHELESGLEGLIRGTFHRGRAYSTSSEFFEKQLQQSLKNYKHFANGRTGRPLKNKVYRGCIFQMRLKHLVRDKEHARGVGPVMLVTRQPTETRWQNSGLRYGEMERDCLVGYGAACNARERFYEGSDKFQVHICVRCGIFADANPEENWCECPICGSTDSSIVKKTNMAAATKAFFQELQPLGIMARFEIDHSPCFVRNLNQLLSPTDIMAFRHRHQLQPQQQQVDKLDEGLIEKLVNLCIDPSSSSSNGNHHPEGGGEEKKKDRKKRTYQRLKPEQPASADDTKQQGEKQPNNRKRNRRIISVKNKKAS